MGFVGALFGAESGNTGGAGMNYQASMINPEYMARANDQAVGAVARQQNFVDALAANQGQAIGNQAMLGNLLAANAMGGGPNPVMAQYQQNMNNIAQQQAGAIASQKGISPALAARMIAQQGGAAQQQAAGQAATLQAQQQLNAQNALAGFTGQQIGQQQNAMNGLTQGAMNQQSNLLGLQANANTSNAGVSQATARGQQGLFGGAMNAVGGVLGLADGGEVPKKPGIGDLLVENGDDPILQGMTRLGAGIQNQLKGSQAPAAVPSSAPVPGSAAVYAQPNYPAAVMTMPSAMPSPAMPNYAQSVMNMNSGVIPAGDSGFSRYIASYKSGGVVPGSPKVNRDSSKNDVVPAMLTPKEIVLPLSVTLADDAPKKAAEFVAAIKARNGLKAK